MEHLVRFTTAEGRDGLHYADGLDEALRFVERVRNAEEAAQVRVFRLHEVPIQFRTYYKVELTADLAVVPSAESLAAAAPPDSGGDHGARPAQAPSLGASEHDHQPEGNGRRLFGRG